MARCIRCGASFWTHIKVKLKDGYICGKCYKELGFSDFLLKDVHTYDEIKDGYGAYVERKNRQYWGQEAEKVGVTLPHFFQLSSVHATDMEKKIFAAIYAVLYDEGVDADAIEIASGGNGSVSLSVGGTVFITYKADEGVKWIVFENESPDKIRIAGAGRMNSLAPRIIEAYKFAAE